MGIRKLIENYGTHAMVVGYMGGRVDYSMKVNTTKVKGAFDISAFVKAGYKGFFKAEVEVEAKYVESYQNYSSACEVTINTIGGDMRVEKREDLTKWHEKIQKEDQGVLMDFDHDSLIPIWELCEDEQRASEIKDYILGEYYGSVMGSFISSKMVEVDIPTFGPTAIDLVRKATVDGITVAQICNEYIPSISKNERVTVVYPVLNNITHLDCGLFVGNANNQPATVKWTKEAVLPEVKSCVNTPQGAVSKVYIKGTVLSAKKKLPSTITTRSQQSVEKLEWFRGKKLDTYPIVKIGKNFWLAEDYEGTESQRGDTLGTRVIFNRIFYNFFAISSDLSPYFPLEWIVPTKEISENLKLYLQDSNKELFAGSGKTGFNLRIELGYFYYKEDNSCYIGNGEHHYWVAGTNPQTLRTDANAMAFYQNGMIKIVPAENVLPNKMYSYPSLRFVRDTKYIHLG